MFLRDEATLSVRKSVLKIYQIPKHGNVNYDYTHIIARKMSASWQPVAVSLRFQKRRKRAKNDVKLQNQSNMKENSPNGMCNLFVAVVIEILTWYDTYVHILNLFFNLILFF